MWQCVGALFQAGADPFEGVNGCKRGRSLGGVMEVFILRGRMEGLCWYSLIVELHRDGGIRHA